MSKRIVLTSLITLFSVFVLQAQGGREIQATKFSERPKIDGILNEECWGRPAFKGKFFEFKPNNGNKSKFGNKIYMGYDDNALYIAAFLLDNEPEKINKEFGLRDQEWKASDKFAIVLDTYNNGQNAFRFVVNASGVQSDVNITGGNWDYNWNAVWNSAVTHNDKGWIVEIEIPFSAIRFPKKEVQDWKINFFRHVYRTSEESFWNYVDNSVSGFIHQSGSVKGIQGINPPLRLSFAPYLSASYTKDDVNNIQGSAIGGGMDLRYGINESFTLDMSLIPDFSQVRSDNVVLNLSAFEVRNGENRPFFTEGTALFNKGGLFYSRRVGQSTGSLEYSEEETLIERSTETSMVNALKISGRTKSKTGIGIFNAVTKDNIAKVQHNDTGEIREIVVDPLTNYNIVVVDQNLKNNSRVGFINTNVTRTKQGRDANVTGVDYQFRDKANKFSVSGFGGYSRIAEQNSDGDNQITDGYKYNISAGKISGNFRYNIGRNVESDQYNINDMGYMRAANEISHWGSAGYNLFKPYWKFNRFSLNLSVNHNQLYLPQTLTGWNVNARFNSQFSNFWNFNASLSQRPASSYDFYEPRQEGWFVRRPSSSSFNMGLSTDGRKPFHLSFGNGFYKRKDWNQFDVWYNMGMRWRLNNKASINTRVNFNKQGNSIGYVSVGSDLREQNQLEDDIIFGERDIKTTTTTFGASYTINEKMGFNFNIRHYWSEVNYKNYFELLESGELDATIYDGHSMEGNEVHDTNFNALNIDMVYSWQFAPGSFVNIVWKDAIVNQNQNMDLGFGKNLSDVLNQSQVNGVSIKITYYLDYLTIKNKI